MQQGHDVDLEVALQHGRVDLLKIAEGAADRVVDDDLRRAELAGDAAQHRAHLMRVGHVSGEGVRAGDVARELAQALLGARDRRPRMALARTA